jgi:hypothetical protein
MCFPQPENVLATENTEIAEKGKSITKEIVDV